MKKSRVLGGVCAYLMCFSVYAAPITFQWGGTFDSADPGPWTGSGYYENVSVGDPWRLRLTIDDGLFGDGSPFEYIGANSIDNWSFTLPSTGGGYDLGSAAGDTLNDVHFQSHTEGENKVLTLIDFDAVGLRGGPLLAYLTPGHGMFLMAWHPDAYNDGINNIAEDLFFEYNGVVVQPVPLPTAVWLFVSGLLGLIGIARRRKHQ